MSEKIAKFAIANIRRLTPANDNRVSIDRAQQQHRPRLACRWSIDAAGRLGCQWGVEAPDGSRSAPARQAQHGHSQSCLPTVLSDKRCRERPARRRASGRWRTPIMAPVLQTRH